MRARDRILEMFKDYRELSVKEITDRTSFCKQMIHYTLKQLILAKQIERIGHPPKTIYRLIPIEIMSPRPTGFSPGNVDLDDFLVVTGAGEMMEGETAFLHWCRERSLPPEEMLIEYGRIQQKHARYHDTHRLIDGLDMFTATMGYGSTWLNGFNFLDFDTMGKFGKTRLGTLVCHAKHSQSKVLMELLVDSIATRILDFIKRNQPDAIGFVPPVIHRNFQLIKYIQSRLDIPLPLLDIKKISNTAIPQTSIPTLGERRRNADNNFCVTARKSFDAVVVANLKGFTRIANA